MPSDIPEPWNDWETLIAAAILEERRAVLAFAETVGFIARRFLRGKGLPPADAESLAATCVTEIFWKLRKFPGGHFPAWARKVMLHQLCDDFRKRSRSVKAGGDAALEQRPNGSTEARRASPQMRRAVADALAALDADERLIAQLRFCGEEVEYKEIAAALGTSPGTVRVRCHRLREKLERLLRGDARKAPLVARCDAFSEKQTEPKGEQYAR